MKRKGDYETQVPPQALTEHQWERLLVIIAKAAPPRERVADNYFTVTCSQDPQIIEGRSVQWIEAATRGDRAAFYSYLSTVGLSWSDFVMGLSDVTVKNPRRLPPWGEALVSFLQSQADTSEEPSEANPDSGKPTSTETATPMQLVYQAYVRAGSYQLRSTLTVSGLEVSKQAASQLAAQLANRLVNATSRALDFELQVGSTLDLIFRQREKCVTPILNVSLDAWLDRLERLPGLAYVIGVTCAHWLTATVELFDRLLIDWEMLRKELWNEEDPRVLTDFSGDAGDPHDGGRSVALLTFAGGKRVVYKAKDLRIAAAFIELVQFLNAAGLSLQLPIRKILPRSSYGWEEYIEHSSCQTEQQVKRFYFRMGMTIRLLQFVEGRDFWLDNLIASGEHPVFIDLETVLQPRNRKSSTLSPAEREAFSTVEGSVVRTGAITAPRLIGLGTCGEDFGALTPWRELTSPFKPVLRALQFTESPPKINKQGYFTWTPPSYVPILDNHPVDISHYHGSIFAGYRAMHDCLRANYSTLSAEDGSLQKLANLPVRYIWRDTWDCYAIILDSVGPLALRDGITREIGFARLFRAPLIDYQSSEAATRIIHSEINAFRDLDVPLFLAVPSRRSVLTAEGTEIPNYFEGTAYDRLLARTVDNEFSLEEQLDLFKSCIDSGHHGRRTSPEVFTAPLFRTYSGGGKNWLDQAVIIGDFILSQAKHGPEGDLAWIGLHYDPFHDMHTVTPLRPDLLTGTCGLAVLFADLFAASGLKRFRTAARQALNVIYRALASTSNALNRDPQLPLTPVHHTPFPCGAFLGIGSQIYALHRCALALGDPYFDHIATSAAASLPITQLCANSTIDVVSGTAGLLLVLPAPTEESYSSLVPLVDTLAEYLLQYSRLSKQPPRPPYPPEATFLDGLPGTAEGVQLALGRANQYRPFWNESIQIDDVLTKGQNETAGDSPRHASSGKLLAALGRYHASRDHELVAEVDRWLDRDPMQMSSVTLLDAIEVAITAYQMTDLVRFSEQAEVLGRQMVTRNNSMGSWFADRFAADRHNLSIVRGVAAVAHTFIKLEDPSRFLSVRLLERPH